MAEQEQIFGWTRARIRDFLRLREKVDTMSGVGVLNQRDRITIVPSEQTPKGVSQAPNLKLPAPQYVGQVYAGVAANTAGFTYLPAVTAI